jgi:hypothetical protein
MQNRDLTVPSRVIVTPLLVLGTVILFFRAMAAGNILLMSIVLAAPFVMMLIGRMDICFMALIMLTGADLYLPGFPTEFTLLDMFSVGLLVLLLVQHLLRHETRTETHVPLPLVFGFFIVLGVTIGMRGLGFRQLGSSLVGGMTYVRLASALVLYLLAAPLKLTAQQWKVALIGYCAIALLPAAADILYVFSHGRLSYLYVLVKPTGSVVAMLDVLESGQGIFRLKRLPGDELLLLALLVFAWRGQSKMAVGVLACAGLLLAGFTGHRLKIIMIIMFAGIFVFVSQKGRRWSLVVKYAAVVFAVVGVAALFASQLPLAMQRALSWIPFIDVSSEAELSAYGTTRWRLALWQRMLEMLPEYLFVGRGFAFDPTHLFGIYYPGRDPYHISWALTSHNYHNGPLGLLLDLGIFGMLLPLGILFAAGWRNLKATEYAWHDPDLSRIHKLVFAKYATLCLVFVFIYGDARMMLRELFLFALFLNQIVESDRMLAQEPVIAEAAAAAPPPEAERAPPPKALRSKLYSTLRDRNRFNRP